jgi:FMN phosphatase YigB (HAD superfamily)
MIKTVIFDLGKVIIPFDFMRGYQGLGGISGLSVAEIRSRIASTDLVQRFECGLVEPADFVAELSRLLEGLSRGYRLLLLSNTNAIHFEMLEKTYPLLRHFHDKILSHRVRAMKPSPAIYRQAIARARCAPNEIFFTDDIADYVAAAKREGIDAVQFESSEQIERELRSRGVRWE